jgi:hypothetical protein
VVAYWQAEPRGARGRERLREGRRPGTGRRSHHNSLETPTRNDLFMCGRDERFYTLEQKPAPALGRLGQLLYPDACARVAALDIVLDTKQRCYRPSKGIITTLINFAHWLWGRVIVRCSVRMVMGTLGRVDAVWVPHLTLHGHVF